MNSIHSNFHCHLKKILITFFITLNIFLLQLKFFFAFCNLNLKSKNNSLNSDVNYSREKGNYYFLIQSPSGAAKLKSQIKRFRVVSRVAPVQQRDQFLFLIKYSLRSLASRSLALRT